MIIRPATIASEAYTSTGPAMDTAATRRPS
jgi:hypothetical protein